MNNYIDTHFNNLIKFIKERSYEQLYDDIKNNFLYYFKKNYSQFKNIENFYNEHGLWGIIDSNNDNFELIKNNTDAFINSCDEYEWLYNHLEDYRSKQILLYVMLYWIMFNRTKIKDLQESFYSQYFDLDLIKCSKDEVFIDIGSYTGDTLLSYINTYGKNMYKNIYCYEIVPANIDQIKNNIEHHKLENVVVREKGVGNTNEKMYIDNDVISSVSSLNKKGNIEVDCVKLDDDIKEKVTYIKMDIEGGELDALKGAKKIIKRDKPKLAICVYHNNNHLWQIPKYIHKLNSDYKFYLRYYGGPILPTEYILYAV